MSENTTWKLVRGLAGLINSDLLHSLACGGVLVLGWFVGWLFFSSSHLLFPKASRKSGNNFKCSCINSKLASLGNQQSSSSFRWFHGLHLAQVNLKKQKKTLVYEPASSSNQWLTQRRLVKAHPSHWVPHSLGWLYHLKMVSQDSCRSKLQSRGSTASLICSITLMSQRFYSWFWMYFTP